MKRRRLLITGVLLLLLVGGGAIVNVAVAWGFSQFQKSMSAQQFHSLRIAPRVHLTAWHEELGFTKVVRIVDHHTGFDSYHSDPPLPWYIARPSEHDDNFTFGELYVGIPIRALKCENIGGYLSANIKELEMGLGSIRGGWLPSQVDEWRAVPLRPLWPGFAINTIFYAAMLWAVFFVPGMVRRRIRRRRGLCPACAYPTWGGGTSPVCTECGKSLA